MRSYVAVLWLCGLMSGCSLLFDAKADEELDLDLSRAIHRIGPGPVDFPSIEAWKSARAGDLGNRQELRMESTLSNPPLAGSRVVGNLGCAGSFRSQSENHDRVTVDIDANAIVCQVGEELELGSQRIRVAQTGPRGIVEVVQLAHKSYTVPLVIDGFVNTSTDHFLIVEADPAQPHKGIVDAGVVIRGDAASGPSHGVEILVDHTQFRGFEVTKWAIGAETNASFEGVHVEADRVLLDQLIVHNDGASSDYSDSDGIFVNLDDVELTVRNSFVFNVARVGIHIQSSIGGKLYIHNCTVHNCTVSDDQLGKYGCIAAVDASATIEVINTLAFGRGENKPAFIVNNTSSFAPGSSNNASDDGTQPGSNGAILIASEVLAQVNGSAEDDLHLSASRPPDSVANSGGQPLSLFDEDIDGEPRGTTVWSIGADQRLPAR